MFPQFLLSCTLGDKDADRHSKLGNLMQEFAKWYKQFADDTDSACIFIFRDSVEQMWFQQTYETVGPPLVYRLGDTSTTEPSEKVSKIFGGSSSVYRRVDISATKPSEKVHCRDNEFSEVIHLTDYSDQNYLLLSLI